jgi:hypothetical protein
LKYDLHPFGHFSPGQRPVLPSSANLVVTAIDEMNIAFEFEGPRCRGISGNLRSEAGRQIGDGRWSMEDGRWKMEDGRWKMEDVWRKRR